MPAHVLSHMSEMDGAGISVVMLLESRYLQALVEATDM
jgi:hypothetical protein